MILKSDLVSSRQNEAVKRLLSLDDKKGRDTESVFVLDGIKLFEEAVKSGAEIDTVYISSEKEEQYLPFITLALQGELYATTRVIRLETSLFERISREKSPQGVITLVKYLDKIQNIIKINKVTTFLNDGVSAQGILLLNGIQDPGNMGTILRTADALEIPVGLLEGCADPYSHKVVRASMGAVFRTPVVQTTWETARNRCADAGISVAVTALSDQAVDLRRAALGAMAVVIGSEGQGVRREILEQADAQLIIPMNPRCESLNAAVAAAIVMWQMRQ